jgi:hypothetical protein
MEKAALFPYKKVGLRFLKISAVTIEMTVLSYAYLAASQGELVTFVTVPGR